MYIMSVYNMCVGTIRERADGVMVCVHRDAYVAYCTRVL
jgi:hypothetical protein